MSEISEAFANSMAKSVEEFVQELKALGIDILLLTNTTADVVERKTCYDTEESRIFRCSECGYGVDDIFEDMDAPVHLFERFENWRFCPCCGAQIKEADT